MLDTEIKFSNGCIRFTRLDLKPRRNELFPFGCLPAVIDRRLGTKTGNAGIKQSLASDRYSTGGTDVLFRWVAFRIAADLKQLRMTKDDSGIKPTSFADRFVDPEIVPNKYQVRESDSLEQKLAKQRTIFLLHEFKYWPREGRRHYGNEHYADLLSRLTAAKLDVADSSLAMRRKILSEQLKLARAKENSLIIRFRLGIAQSISLPQWISYRLEIQLKLLAEKQRK